MNVNVPLWFLPALFSSQLLYYFINKRRSFKLIALVGIAIGGVWLIKYDIRWLPFGLNQAFIAVLFLGVGNLWKDQWMGLPWIIYYIGVGIALVFVIASWPFARFDLESLRVMPFYSYLIDAFMGIGLLLCISRILKGICFINYIGKNSLVIFALQAPVIRGGIYLTSKLLHCNVEYLQMNIGYSIMVTIGGLILMWPVVDIYNRLLNMIKGRFFTKFEN